MKAHTLGFHCGRHGHQEPTCLMKLKGNEEVECHGKTSNPLSKSQNCINKQTKENQFQFRDRMLVQRRGRRPERTRTRNQGDVTDQIANANQGRMQQPHLNLRRKITFESIL